MNSILWIKLIHTYKLLFIKLETKLGFFPMSGKYSAHEPLPILCYNLKLTYFNEDFHRELAVASDWHLIIFIKFSLTISYTYIMHSDYLHLPSLYSLPPSPLTPFFPLQDSFPYPCHFLFLQPTEFSHWKTMGVELCWSVVDFAVGIQLQKNGSPFHGSYQQPTVPQGGVRPHEPLFLPWLSAGPVGFMYAQWRHLQLLEIMIAVALSMPRK